MITIISCSDIESQGRTWPYKPLISDDKKTMICPKHGAMNCVSQDLRVWRCLACGIGCVVERGNE